MSGQVLEITRLSDRGNAERRISCLAGRISVFRAQDEECLNSYEGALYGEHTKERFSVVLDRVSFEPRKHNLLSLDTSRISKPGLTVRDILYAAGVKAEELEELLLCCGLGGLALTPCDSLNEREAYTLRILRATFEPERLLVLKEPFSQLAPEAREGLAERLVRFAWEKNAIVVVSRLSVRPQCWLGSPHIQRIALDRPQAVTVGLSGPVLEVVREWKTPDCRDYLSKLLDPKVAARLQLLSRRYGRSVAMFLVIAVLSYQVGARLLPERPDKVEETVVKTDVVSDDAQEATRDSPSQASPLVKAGEKDVVGVNENQQDSSGLDFFAADIREGVLMAFKDPAEVLRRAKGFPSVTKAEERRSKARALAAARREERLRERAAAERGEEIRAEEERQRAERESAPRRLLPSEMDPAVREHREQIRQRILERLVRHAEMAGIPFEPPPFLLE